MEAMHLSFAESRFQILRALNLKLSQCSSQDYMYCLHYMIYTTTFTFTYCRLSTSIHLGMLSSNLHVTPQLPPEDVTTIGYVIFGDVVLAKHSRSIEWATTTPTGIRAIATIETSCILVKACILSLAEPSREAKRAFASAASTMKYIGIRNCCAIERAHS